MKELTAIVRHLTAPDHGPSVLATLVSVVGSSYRRPGTRLLMTAAGERLGSISGGCLEEDVLARARQVLAQGRAELLTYDTSAENDLVWGVGLGCHGIVQILLEPLPSLPSWATTLSNQLAGQGSTPLAVVWQHTEPKQLGTRLATDLNPTTDRSGVFFDLIAPPTALFIYGAGDDAQPLARFATDLGWRVTIADPRPAFATRERFPGADQLTVAPAAELVTRTAPPPTALAVVMTHHYVHDVPILRELLFRPLAYLGLLGPRKRAERIVADLAGDGFPLSTEQRARLHAPVGLDLGAETPEEVALSIIAEMRATLARRDARPLRERIRPIHHP